MLGVFASFNCIEDDGRCAELYNSSGKLLFDPLDARRVRETSYRRQRVSPFGSECVSSSSEQVGERPLGLPSDSSEEGIESDPQETVVENISERGLGRDRAALGRFTSGVAECIAIGLCLDLALDHIDSFSF